MILRVYNKYTYNRHSNSIYNIYMILRVYNIDAFKCMKHIIEETNRYNISAVAAALHSYIRMTIEKI